MGSTGRGTARVGGYGAGGYGAGGYGAGRYGAGGYGAGYPGTAWPGQPVPPRWPTTRPRTNGFAVTSLVTGLLTPVGVLPGMASLLFGLLGLRQIRRRGQRGTALAVTGMAATAFWLFAVATTAMVFAVVRFVDSADAGTAAGEPDPGAALATPSPSPSPSPSPPDATDDDGVDADMVSVFDLEAGQCIHDLYSEEPSAFVPVVACDEPHEGQVFALFDMPGDEWPGVRTVYQDAYDGCLQTLESDFPDAYQDEWLDVAPYTPTEFTWQQGDREVICLTVYLDERRTGSLFEDGNYPTAPGPGSDV